MAGDRTSLQNMVFTRRGLTLNFGKFSVEISAKPTNPYFTGILRFRFGKFTFILPPYFCQNFSRMPILRAFSGLVLFKLK